MLILSELLGATVLPDPCLCLLNDDLALSFNLNQCRLLMAGLTAAKNTILTKWFYSRSLFDSVLDGVLSQYNISRVYNSMTQ